MLVSPTHIASVNSKGRTIRKLMGAGGGEVQKKNSRKRKLNEKKFLHANQLILKKYSCYSLKKIHTRNFMTKKKFLRLENSPLPPPITSLMVRP